MLQKVHSPAHLQAGWTPWASMHMGSFHLQPPPPPQPLTSLEHNALSSPVPLRTAQRCKLWAPLIPLPHLYLRKAGQLLGLESKP